MTETKTRTHTTKPPTTLLLGAPGSGKTTSLLTYVEAGLDLFVLITDPGGEEALLDGAIKKGLPLNKIHWCYVPASDMSMDEAFTMASKVSTMSYDGLSSLKTGLDKEKHRQFLRLLDALRNFKDANTGRDYGSVKSFGPDKVLAIDSMTGVNKMAKRLVVGGKPTLHQGEWGTAMEVEEQFLDLLVGALDCPLVITAHLERTMDEVRKKPILSIALLGSKLAPKIPSMFSDVVLAYRDGTKFLWSTAALDVDLKGRTLPTADGLDPSFIPINKSWKSREEAIEKALAEARKSAETDAVEEGEANAVEEKT